MYCARELAALPPFYESVELVDRSLIDEIERVVLTPEARRYTLVRGAQAPTRESGDVI